MRIHLVHHTWRLFRRLSPWAFLTLGLVSGVISIAALRANNEHMVKLRTAVYTADQNNANVEGALRSLQSYVTGHMNTNLSSGPNAVYPPIQLKYTYDRIIQAESQQLSQTNSAFYTTAQNYCEQLLPTQHLMSRVDCTEQYLESHDTQHQIAPVQDALYKFSFVSPVWSPDLAGWSLAVAMLGGIAFLVSLAEVLVHKRSRQ